MNSPENNPEPEITGKRRLTAFQRRKGVALILVISFVVLLSALVVGFFSRVTTDLSSSRSYAEGVTVRQLADSAVGVVMGLIREATTTDNGCWASQPGMIRVYRTQGGQPGPNAHAFYKLYSSHDLVVSGEEIRQFNPDVTTSSGAVAPEVPLGTGGWRQQPAFFADLNEPVDVPNPNRSAGGAKTVKRYPIFDPSVALIYEDQKSRPSKPNWTGLVEGCEIALPSADREANAAPMPVRWIYILKDGTLTAPTPLTKSANGAEGLEATWKAVGPDGSPTGVPTKDNPIVGRIAFWTDDDSCKVNINTAGGFLQPDGVDEDKEPDYTRRSGSNPETNPAFYAGSFWDTPRIQTQFDRGFSADPANYRGGLANSQPVRNEFQRYPGHPSTTSLGLVFKNILGNTRFDSEELYTLTPRISPGGSQGGTRQLIAYDVRIDPDVYGIEPDPPLTIKRTFDPDVATGTSYHLLAAVDELLYTTVNGRRELAERVAGLPTNSLNAETIDKVRFFLTANNRSPELNVHGRPRVTVWPVPTPESEGILRTIRDPKTGKSGILNPSDDLLRFCSTIGGNSNRRIQQSTRQGEFIFDRQDPYSPVNDFIGLPSRRNEKVFNYLRDVTSSQRGKIPGWGKSFEEKYAGGPGGRDQILTEIFDYIRSVNLKDTSRDQRIDDFYNRRPGGPTIAKAQELKAISRYAKRGIVVPTRAKVDGRDVSGFGRFPTLSEVSVVFYHGGFIFKNAKGEEDVEYNFVLLDKRPANKTQAEQDATTEWYKNNTITHQLLRAFLIVETYNPMQGYGPVTSFDRGRVARERIVHEITNITGFQISAPGLGATPLNLGAGTNHIWRSSGSSWAGRNFGGTEGFFHTIEDKTSMDPTKVFQLDGTPPHGSRLVGRGKAFEDNVAPFTGNVPQTYYPFQTPCQNKFDGVRIPIDTRNFNFEGGQITFAIRYKDNAHDGLPAHDSLIQSMTLDFPKASGWPLPITEAAVRDNDPLLTIVRGSALRNDLGGFDPRRGGNGPFPSNANIGGANQPWASYLNTWRPSRPSGYAMPFHLPSRIAWAQQHSYAPWNRLNVAGKDAGGDDINYGSRHLQIVQPGDTIRSLVPGGANGDANDPRVNHLQQMVDTFKPHPDYFDGNKRRAQTLRMGNSGFYFDPGNALLFPGENTQPRTGALTAATGRYPGSSGPDLPRGVVAKRGVDGGAADFDTGLGNFPDGAFTGKADEGNVARSWKDIWDEWFYVEPYFSTWVYDPPGDTYFSPNRQIPGPVMFGSLLAPQGPWNKAAWKTLLFCPNPAGENHPGSDQNKTQVPDHLWLDLFNMPVVEPYAISEPFSTAGKVNLNYQLMPFGYITRSTALRAALQPLRVTAIPDSFRTGNDFKYKIPTPNRITVTINGQSQTRNIDNPENLRYLVDREETLKAFEWFFDQYRTNKNEGFFKSASQICERFLYPRGRTIDNQTLKFTANDSQVRQWWRNQKLTGDNVREKPYADLYQRVTTKSNTYTVHYRVQTLRQRPYTGNAAGADAYYRMFDESRDQVLSEYRGHTTIERYLDPEDPRFSPTYTQKPNQPAPINVETQSLEDAYRFRIISNKRFSPW